MLTNLKAKLPILFLVLLMLAMIIYQQWPDQKLHIVFCDVGQGDAILVSQGQWQLLIDGGPEAPAVMSCLNRHMPVWDRNLELLVVTHADQDHIGGLPQVLASYKVGATLISDKKSSQTYQKLSEALVAEYGISNGAKTSFSPHSIRPSSQLKIDILWPPGYFLYISNMQRNQDSAQHAPFCMFSILGQQSFDSNSSRRAFSTGGEGKKKESLLKSNQPQQQSKLPQTTQQAQSILQKPSVVQMPDIFASHAEKATKTILSDANSFKFLKNLEHNDRSITLFLHFLQFDLLLTGDVTEQIELALLDRGVLTNTEMLKCGHHGAKSSTSTPFLTEVRPETSIISCGLNNRFSHPASVTLDRLQKIGSQVYQTSQLGEVEVVTDGYTYQVFTGQDSF